ILCTYTNNSNYAIVFQKSSGTDPVIMGKGGVGSSDAIITFNGGNYYTFNGVDFADDSTDNVGSSNSAMEYALYFNGISSSGCGGNTIQNCNITLYSANTNSTYPIYFSNTTGNTTTNNNNTVSNVNIQVAKFGVYFNNTNSTAGYLDAGNQITSNTISHMVMNNNAAFSSIYAYGQQNLTISNNRIYNIYFVSPSYSYSAINFAG